MLLIGPFFKTIVFLLPAGIFLQPNNPIMRRLKTLLLCVFACCNLQLYATHIIGGEIVTTYLGGNNYEIKLILYRDCSGYVFDDFACIGLYSESGSLYTTITLGSPDISDVDIASPDPCIIIPPDLCVEQGVYTGTYTLPNSTQAWDLVYQRCCRNPGIVNIIGPDEAGLSCWGHIPAIDDYDGNSSPYFNNYPPSAICAGTALHFDYSATDPDGDSLAYRFITPYTGASYLEPMPCPPAEGPDDLATIDWSAGYSDAYPVDALPALSIDPVTGLLTGTPTSEGRYVVCVAVDEFRDGELLSTHYRDFQFNIQICEPIVIASTLEYVLDCDDFSVEFSNFSVGADEYWWDFGDGTSSTEFEPYHTYGDTGTYEVLLIANPGAACSDTAIATIKIYSTLTADFTFEAGCSNEPVLFTDESITTEAGEIISWLWEFADGTTSTEQNPAHQYTTGGIYSVTLTVQTDKGCISTITFTVNLDSGPTADFLTENICLGQTASFDNTTIIPVDITVDNYIWNFGDGELLINEGNAFHTYNTAGDFTVTLIAVGSSGCNDTTSQPVHVGELPYPDAGPDDTVSYYELYTMQGDGNGTFHWSPEDLVSEPDIEDPTIYPFSTNIYTLEVTSPDGCVDDDQVTIFVEYISAYNIPNAFSPNGDGLNDVLYVINHLNITLLEFTIYDRWGELVFTSNDIHNGWDGTINNQEAEVGTYMYVMRALDEDQKNFMVTGNVVLLR